MAKEKQRQSEALQEEVKTLCDVVRQQSRLLLVEQGESREVLKGVRKIDEKMPPLGQILSFAVVVVSLLGFSVWDVRKLATPINEIVPQLRTAASDVKTASEQVRAASDDFRANQDTIVTAMEIMIRDIADATPSVSGVPFGFLEFDTESVGEAGKVQGIIEELREDSQEAHVLLASALSAILLEDFARARDMLESAKKLDPENTAIYEGQIGRSFLVEGSYEQCASSLERTLRLNPRNASAQANLGFCYVRLANTESDPLKKARLADDGVAAARAALAEDSAAPQNALVLATILHELGRYEEAAQVLHVFEGRKGRAVYWGLAVNYAKSNQGRQAIEALEELVILDSAAPMIAALDVAFVELREDDAFLSFLEKHVGRRSRDVLQAAWK